MEVKIMPGKYIMAVSGGVDSVVLLDLLSKLSSVELVVAHFNHGIREQANQDEKFVEKLAAKYGYRYEADYGQLGRDASEEQARTARYRFLRDMRAKHEAVNIITAHHQDDLIETAVINILRGTGPRGLVAMMINPDIIRPLLNVSKNEIVKYARTNNLNWVEDESNRDGKYLRNMVRAILSQKMAPAERRELLKHIDNAHTIESEKDLLLQGLACHVFEDAVTLSRSKFIFLPDEVAREMVLYWLRANNVSADKKIVQRLSVAIKTARPDSWQDIDKNHRLQIGRQYADLVFLG